MKLVIEVSDVERSALAKFTASIGVPYSVLVRTLLRLAIDGTVPRAKLLPALKERPVINVTLSHAPKPVTKVAHEPDIYERTGFKKPKK